MTDAVSPAHSQVFYHPRRMARPLSNPHYIRANVGHEDVQVMKHHHTPLLYGEKETQWNYYQPQDKYNRHAITYILLLNRDKKMNATYSPLGGSHTICRTPNWPCGKFCVEKLFTSAFIMKHILEIGIVSYHVL